KEFVSAKVNEPVYQILDIYECPKTKFTKAQIKLSGRHILEKNISDIVTDLKFLEEFDKKTIRTLTYLATVERMKPDYTIVVQKLGDEVDNYILEIRSKNDSQITKKSAFEMSRDKSLLAKFSPLDANRIGYLAGIQETAREFKMKPNKED
ncbi:MAG TPA: hypothetical protein VHM20_07485, partial [Gammaproteobacteria bacterium]|nr:hypothetical protein [Gammaproteobacteria bacterium]